MAYELEIPDPVADYLDGLPLSDAGRASVAQALEHLGLIPDRDRLNPAIRVAPDHPCFPFVWLFNEPAGTRAHKLTLVVDDRPAAQGVLRVTYAEYEAHDRPA